MRLLIVNPNTDSAATAAIAAEAIRAAADGTEIIAVTAPSGPPVLVTPEDMVRAGPIVVETIKAHPGIDAAISGAFSDPGLDMARSVFAFPVVGLREAAFTEAAALGRFTVVATNPLSEAAYHRCAQELGVEDSLVSIRFIAVKGYGDRDAILPALIAECAKAAEEDGSAAAVIAGGPLAGMASEVAPHVQIPVIDCVAAAVRQAERRVLTERSHHA